MGKFDFFPLNVILLRHQAHVWLLPLRQISLKSVGAKSLNMTNRRGLVKEANTIIGNGPHALALGGLTTPLKDVAKMHNK